MVDTKIKFVNPLSEDFGMGVGGALGLTQGIPNGGDGVGVVPMPMGDEEPKKKKKKKKKHEINIQDYFDRIVK